MERPISSRRGLTLIEMIVTLAILGTFLSLLSFHLVGLSNLWLNRTDDDFFEQHVDGVSLFLDKALEASEAAVATTGGGEDGEELPVQWQRLPGASDIEDPLLFFRQKEAPALLVREGRRLPAIEAYLHFEEDLGLSILWYSTFDAEEMEREEDLFRTPVSEFVTRIEYAYYEREDDDWEREEDPLEEDNNDTFRLPDFLILTFSHPEKGERERFLRIPQRSPDLPLF